MNWADLSSVMIVLTGGFAGGIVAAAEKTAWWVIVIFLLGGLLIGIAAASLSSRLAYLLLDRGIKGAAGGFTELAYMAIPVFFLLAVLLGTTQLGAWMLETVR